MAVTPTPAFTQTPVLGSVATSGTGDTGYGGGGTAPTTAVVVVAAGGTNANGAKINEITIVPTGSVTPCVVNLFLFDGTTYWLYDQAQYFTATLSQSVAQVRWSKQYSKLILPPTWSLRATVTVTQTSNVFIVTALGGDF
jgi:hypothetical protein